VMFDVEQFGRVGTVNGSRTAQKPWINAWIRTSGFSERPKKDGRLTHAERFGGTPPGHISVASRQPFLVVTRQDPREMDVGDLLERPNSNR